MASLSHARDDAATLASAGSSLRMVLCAALILVSAVLIARYGLLFLDVLRTGVANAPVTVDFNIYRCGVTHPDGPYGVCGNGEAVGGFVYPPPSIPYFKALALLPLDIAFVVHSLVAAIAVGAAIVALVRLAPVSRVTAWMAALATLAIAPVGTSFVAGQVNTIVMACCVLAVAWSTTGKHARAGLMVALGFWLKLYPAIVPALFLPRERWPGIVATVVATIALALVALPWAGPQLYWTYFVDFLPHVQGYTMPGVAQSLAGMVAHAQAGGGDPIMHFQAVPPAIAFASKGLLVLGVLAAMAHQYLTRDACAMRSLGILLCGALLAAPNAWGYHYALIVPALFLALADTIARPSWTTPLVLGCWLALCVPAWTVPPAFVADVPWLNVLVRGRYALVALVLLVLALVPARNRRSASTSQA